MPLTRYIAFFLLLLVFGLEPAVFAQTALPQDAGDALELLQSKIAEIDASSEIDEASRTTLFELYRKAVSQIEQRRSFEATTRDFVRARETAAQTSTRLRREIEQLEAAPPVSVPASRARQDLAQLEQRLLSVKADQTAVRSRLADLEARLEAQARRPEQGRARLGELKSRQDAVASTLAAPQPESGSPRIAEARRWALQLEARALAAEIEMLNQELLSHPVRIELLGVQRDLARLELNRVTDLSEQLGALVVERRQAEAEIVSEATEETRRQAIGKHPLVQEMAQRNTQLGDDLKALASALERVTNDEILASERAKRVSTNFRLARQKLEIAGLSEALGQVLLEQRRNLPTTSDFESAAKRRQQLVIESSLRQIRNQQEREQLRNLTAYINEIIGHLQPYEQDRLREELEQLAQTRRELIDKAIAADDSFLQALGELDFAQRQLAETVADYDAFLDERLLWIRSGDPPSWQMLKTITATLAIFASPVHWLDLGRALFVPQTFPWALLLGLLLFGLLQFARQRLRASLRRSGRNVGDLRRDRYITTLRALLQTLILALPWPILFAALGWHLQQVPGLAGFGLDSSLYQAAASSGQFVPAIGAAFAAIALYTYYFLAFRIFCEPEGLAVAHFDWNGEDCHRLRVETRRLMAILLPAAFLLVASITYDPAALAGGLSRVSFVVVMIALAWFSGRIFAPGQGIMRRFYAVFPDSPVTWLRYLWLLLGLSLPLALAVLATIGYVYTAAQFGARLVDTLWLIVAIVLVHQLVVRWLLMTERRLAFEATIESSSRPADQPGSDAATAPIDPQAKPYEEPEVDYESLGQDTKKLLTTVLTLLSAFGLWVIWSDVLPAFGILDAISLWSYSAGGDKLIPVTLGDVILSVLIVAVGFIAALRLPALIEIALLARLRITAGSRYAISTLTQYAIVGAAIVLAFNLLGGSWSEIQWLVAALGVGIGFGLQEIVANFISGLILLFERPIRIGDIVTVGDTTGTVTRIRIRSTTIRNWDQQELIVPNKEFITGRLLNWTLTDPIARIVIPVGIAYGSDVGEAIKLIHETATEHERVLADPEPLVTFDNFGDSTLMIVLRCYIGSMDHRLVTQSELNLEINRKLEAAGIVVAFPQQDVHLDTSRPLDVRIHRVAEET